MNLASLGLGAALVLTLPGLSSAQGTKPVVERQPVIKRGNPTASPKASPAGAVSAGAPARAPIETPETDEPIERRVIPPGPASLQASIGYTRIGFDINRPLAHATGGLVPFTVKYTGRGSVASVQVPGSLSYPLGSHSGSFEQTIPTADIRAIMKRDEAAILARCTSTLDYNKVESINTVHDAQLPVTVNGADGAVVASTTVPYQLGLTCTRVPPLTVTIGYTRIEFDVNRPLAHATGGLVPLTLKYNGGGNVASVQVPGSLSYPLGIHSGSFQQTISNADIRAIMKRGEAAILARCTSTLDYNNVETINTVHDAQLPVTVNGADGGVIASTTVPYQLGLTCKRVPPLAVAIGYTRIEYSIAQPLAHAKGGLVPLTVKFNGTAQVASVQVPGSLSYPIGAHSGSFEQTLPNADIRAIMKRDEAAILDRCKSTLDYNKVDSINTVHDAQLPVTVNGPDGTVVASITLSYQLGLNCTR